MPDYIRRGAAIEQFEDSTSAIPEKLARIRIEEVPAADVVEVRHGWWIAKNADGSWRVDTCSVCNKDTHYVRFAPEYDFCPNCGAKMDGKELGK